VKYLLTVNDNELRNKPQDWTSNRITR